jgi:hypothetical protein
VSLDPATAHQVNISEVTSNMWKPTMPFDSFHQVTQCSIVVQQSHHLFPSHHLNFHSASLHGASSCLWVLCDPVTAKPLHALQPANDMCVQPCCLIAGIICHNAMLLFNTHTTDFLHTTSTSTLHHFMAYGCHVTLSQQTRSIYQN